MDNAFARVESIVNRLRNVLKCQKCLELKSEDSMLYYQLCDHFYCTDCEGRSDTCSLCNNPLNKQKKVVDDKNILSLYQCLAKFELPSKQEIEKIYKNHFESKQNNEKDVKEKEEDIPETPKNHTRKKSARDRFEEKEQNKQVKNEALLVKKNEENSDSKVFIETKNKTPVPKKGRQNMTRNVTPAATKTTPLNNSAGSSKGDRSVSKININKRNPKGETQLHIACKKSNFDSMKELIAAGANPNAQDNAGWTPLHDSVFSGKLDVMKFLLDNGAKVNAPGLENMTALHEAIAKGNVRMVKLLLEYGADIKALNIFRETPLDLATKYKLSEMKELLLKASNNMKDCSSNDIEEKIDNIVIYKHNLDLEDEKLVNKFAEKFNAELTSSLISKISPTHIIVSKENFEITWGLISSVVAGCWLVTIDWVKDSLSQSAPKSPNQYTPSKSILSGFSKARANKLNQHPGLFSGCHFFFGGNFDQYNVKSITFGKENLKLLIEKQGGAILKRCPDPESLALEKTVPYHAPSTSSLRDTSYFIIYQTEKWDPKPKYNMSHMKTLPVEWLIDCICKFELVDPKEIQSFCNFL